MIDRDITRASTLPASLYTEASQLEVELERIFFRTWQAVGRADDVRHPGDFFTCTLLGQPLVVSRGTDGTLRAFYNVCRHRAGAVACGKGNRKVLQCRYHGWTYALDGRLLKAREFEQARDFDPAEFGLVPVAVEQSGPLVLVNLAGEPSLEAFLGEIVAQTSGLDLERCRLVESREYVVECNWKVYVENYLEGYHIPIAHPGLFREVDYDRYRVETRRYHSRQVAPLRPASNEGPPRLYTPLEPDEDVLYYWVFPNLMLNFYPDNLQVNIILPQGHDRTLTLFDWYFHEEGTGEGWERLQQGIAFSHQVQQEDICLCEAVQQGLASRAYSRGRFCPTRENGVHHFQLLVAEFLGL